jgi:phosphocarrier protein HPr
MIEKVYTVTSASGVHARPATLLVNTVHSFSSEVFIEYKNKQINLKSIIGVMSLGIPEGAKVKVTAEGYDSVQVIESIDGVMQQEGLGVW